jgi:protein-disulfide isomerase
MDEQQKSSPLQNLPPKQVFILGIVAGVLALCTIGFVILLSIMLKGGDVKFLGAGAGTPPPPAPIADAGDVPSAQITLRAVDAKNDHIRGAKDAKVTIVEYSDLECPFCKRFHNTMKQVISAYPNDVRWVYRHFPLDSLHQQARQEALSTECAAEQGKFWEFADLIFQETPSNDGLDLTKLPDYAKRLGLNVTKFNECLNSSRYASRVTEDEQDTESAGARGTPYSVLIGPNGEKVPLSGALPAAQIKAAIDSALAAS